MSTYISDIDIIIYCYY